MAISPIASPRSSSHAAQLGQARSILLIALSLLLVLCFVLLWTTRGAMASLPFLAHNHAHPGDSNLVDTSPWDTVQALAPLAVTAEEVRYAREAERLADHDVDQAFASALRRATLKQQRRVLTGQALQISQQVQQLQQLIIQDQAQVDALSRKTGSSSAASSSAASSSGSDDLDVAKAQLALDSDELVDAQRDLERASGDQSVRIQEELTAHEAAMRQYDNEAKSDGLIAVISEKKHATLLSRIQAWFGQNSRSHLILQAQQNALNMVQALTAQHNQLEAQTNQQAASENQASGRFSALDLLRQRSATRQILSIYDDRIQTEQQLAAVYAKWAAQVQLQHNIVLHLMLQSFALILFIALCMVIGDVAVRRLMNRMHGERRQTETLRNISEVAIQVLGIIFILLIVFGAPQQTSTILGLATAALTIALQDFILAFLGWFVLVGRHGIHVGDWVEINGVGGEVIEVGLFRTMLLETGSLADKGHPTGRRITFINSFAIRGQFFNFSTAGQWMWDEIQIDVPETDDLQSVVEGIHKLVLEETERNAREAEQEWKRGARGEGLNRFSATPAVALRPTGSGIEVDIRYVTRASERFDLRNRLYDRIVHLMRRGTGGVTPSHDSATVQESASPSD
ncbi:MAG TPA: mechanosensitive ion channel family protein [Terracidiphilus sp.]|nr:mechanosensitive ion channel family protein [Terracidiphilus sp.]